jgi:putative peptidoglycan lipid II flippase
LSLFVIAYVIVNQIGYLIVQILAASNRGDFAAYITAFTFFMLPHGLFAVSITTALLPGMSELAVTEKWDEFRARLSTGIRTTALLIFPAAIGYLVLGKPIVRFMLERGVMTAESTDLVAGVLRLFVIGLLPFSLFQLFLRAFYSLQNTKTPFLINCAAVGLNTAVNLAVYGRFGVEGLAAGHAAAYTFGAFLQARALSKRIGGLDGRVIARSVGRIAIAAAGMGLLVWLTSRALEGVLEPTFVGQSVGLLVPVAVGVVSYLVLARLLRVPELDYAKGLLTRRSAKGD